VGAGATSDGMSWARRAVTDIGNAQLLLRGTQVEMAPKVGSHSKEAFPKISSWMPGFGGLVERLWAEKTVDSRQPHVNKQREDKGNREESRSARTVTMRGRCGRALHRMYHHITIISRDPDQGLICNNC